ncbi:MAG: hypothetical protein ACRDKI_11700 [Solirubrobacterales bacterium]
MDDRNELRAPNGDRWRVKRHWAKRPRYGFFKRDNWPLDGVSPLDFADLGFADSFSGLIFGVIAAIAIFLFFLFVVIVLMPLLGVVIEVAVLVGLVSSGIFGRVVLRRPWTINAVNVDNPLESRDYKVVGWARSRQAIAALRQTIATTGPPSTTGDRLI